MSDAGAADKGSAESVIIIAITAVMNFKETENGISFIVEGNEDAQITVGLSEDTEYQVKVKGEAIGMMKTNLGGKLVLSVELAEEDEVEVEITR